MDNGIAACTAVQWMLCNLHGTGRCDCRNESATAGLATQGTEIDMQLFRYGTDPATQSVRAGKDHIAHQLCTRGLCLTQHTVIGIPWMPARWQRVNLYAGDNPLPLSLLVQLIVRRPVPRLRRTPVFVPRYKTCIDAKANRIDDLHDPSLIHGMTVPQQARSGNPVSGEIHECMPARAISILAPGTHI